MSKLPLKDLRKMMKGVKNLSDVPKEEQKRFVDSFDTILFDCDGVLWFFGKPIIPNTDKVLANLKHLQKSLYFVTNNTLQSSQSMIRKFENSSFYPTEEMIIHPVLGTITYLKSINFNKSILTVASGFFKDELVKAGFHLIEPCQEKEDLLKFNFVPKHIDESVGAVLLDIDPNVTFANINEVITAVSNPEILFLVGATDRVMPMTKTMCYAGPGMMHNIVEECSGRRPMVFGKPGKAFSDIVIRYCNVQDPRRTLFVGDSFQSDMLFASISGFQKLLVLSPLTDIDVFQKSDDLQYVPDYYLDCLADLLPILEGFKQ